MPETIAVVCALLAILLGQFLITRWLVRKSLTEEPPPRPAQLLSGALAAWVSATTLGVVLIILGQSGPASEATDWSRHTETVGTLSYAEEPIVTTIESDYRVQVPADTLGTSYKPGGSISFSCPPGWEHMSAPACQDNTLRVICGKGNCESYILKLLLPVAGAGLIVVAWAYRRFRRSPAKT